MSEVTPELEAPGAGLPWFELRIVRLRIWWLVRSRSQNSFAALFASEKTRIMDLVSNCGTGPGSQRVLIDRLRGMEDSSRHWSVFMTLDHLRIVNVAFTGLVRNLGRGIVPEGKISTADVKPDPEAGINVVGNFERSCDLFLRCWDAESSAPELRFPHPWFGGMNCDGWRAVGAIHMRVHRLQIERILTGLG